MEDVHGPCRLPYELVTCDKLESFPFSSKISSTNKNVLKSTKIQNVSLGNVPKCTLLSTKDLCGLDYLPQLIKAGVMCFKIEGRMKTPEYVATVTRIYRKYIDLALSENPYVVDEKDRKDLLQVFNRGGFSCGHLDSKPNKELVFPEKPNHMGIYVGNIASLKSNKGHVFVNLTDSIALGDTLQFENESSKYTISELMLKGKNIPSAHEKQLVEIGRMKGNLHVGDKIYRVSSKELSTFAKTSYQEEHKKVLLQANIVLKKEEPIVLNVSTCKVNNPLFANIQVSFSSEEVPVAAKSKPIEKDRIIAQLNKTTDTIFTFDKINVILEDNLFLPSIKVLNELRRKALEEIYFEAESRLLRKSPTLKNVLNLAENNMLEKPQALQNLAQKDVLKQDTIHKDTNKSISVLLNILNENEDYTKLKKVNKVYIPLKYFGNKKYAKVVRDISTNFPTYIYLPTIVKSNYKNLLNTVVEKSINTFPICGFVVSNLASGKFIEQLQQMYPNKFDFIGNYTLNVFNHETQQELKDFGINTLTISPELDATTIQNLLKNPVCSQELIVYGRTPLMSMNYCLLGQTNKCYPTCGARCKEEKEYYLKDRLGITFRIVPDSIQTVSTIYNSKITSIDTSDFDVYSYRLDILEESVEQTNSIIETILAGRRLEGKDYTNGNLNREI